MMHDSIDLVAFRMNSRRYALRLDAVERIVRAVEITPLPNSPPIVMGAVDVAGRVLPVLNLRRRLGLPEREITLSDQLLIAKTTRRSVILVIDEAEDVVVQPESAVIDADQVVPGLEHVSGLIQLADGLVLIHDVENFLSLDEEQMLSEALASDVADAS